MTEQDNTLADEKATLDAKGVQLKEGKFSNFELAIPFASSWTYANVFAFSVSPMDIRISFGEALPSGTAEARTGIVMTPDQAAYLCVALFKQLAEFEKRFGKIRTPAWQALGVTAGLQELPE